MTYELTEGIANKLEFLCVLSYIWAFLWLIKALTEKQLKEPQQK